MAKAKTEKTGVSKYNCNYGYIGLSDNFSNVQYATKDGTIAYLHYLTDFDKNDLERKAGEVWCFAKASDQVANDVCKNMGGTFGNSSPTSWTRYKIR